VTFLNSSKLRSFFHPVIVCLLLMLATLAVYAPVRNYGFVDFDDNEYFFSNPHVAGGFTRVNIKWAFTTADTGNWHPLTWLSLMLDAQFFGSGAGAPHVTNVLLHAANSVLVFALFLHLTGALWRCAAMAMLFAVHPLHVESVTWVAERKDILSAFFGLLALLFYARYAKSEGFPNIKQAGPYTAAVLFFICGLMSKSMIVTLPFVMLLMDFWPLQRFKDSQWKRLLIEKIPFFLLIVADSVVTFIAQQRGNAVTPLARFPLDMRLENVFVSYARYLGRQPGDTVFASLLLASVCCHSFGYPVRCTLRLGCHAEKKIPVHFHRMVLVHRHAGSGDWPGAGWRAIHGRPLYLSSDYRSSHDCGLEHGGILRSKSAVSQCHYILRSISFFGLRSARQKPGQHMER